MHYVAARFGCNADGLLPCADYATYGSKELAANVAATLGDDGKACLMANHGAVALADDLDRAFGLAVDVEWLCGVYRRAMQLGDPVALPPDEITKVAARFGGYAQP